MTQPRSRAESQGAMGGLRYPLAADKMKKTRVIILGGGFAGLSAAMYLDKTLARRADVEVTLISRENFILFTPMLHEVAAGDRETSST